MQLTNINTKTLRKLLSLLEKRESLLEELKTIELAIEEFVKKGAQPPLEVGSDFPLKKELAIAEQKLSMIIPRKGIMMRKKRAPRGSIKKKIIEALTAAGSKGLKVMELSKKIGMKPANIHVWFTNQGKQIPEIEKIGPGSFRIVNRSK